VEICKIQQQTQQHHLYKLCQPLQEVRRLTLKTFSLLAAGSNVLGCTVNCRQSLQDSPYYIPTALQATPLLHSQQLSSEW
jgi:hypothetical protein